MVRSFPARFDCETFEGPHAARCRDDADRFQQLVAAAFQQTHGANASAATTQGPDGAIDVFVAGEGEDPFRMPPPFVVECKHHSEEAKDLLDNLRSGWRQVEKRLTAAAGRAWDGRNAPWLRARGYLYCVSCRLPHQAARQDLEGRIRAFFDSLPEENRPPIEHVRVVDWQDLLGWLDGLPTLADRWLGVGLPLVVSHAEYGARLTGFSGFLSEDRLPFVAPPSDAAFHPGRLLERLESRQASGGVLVTGAGGVGKTRTAFEVACRADAAGWRVLHVLPGEPGIDVERLAEAVLGGRGPTLLTFDYLEQMHRLDLRRLREEVMPESAKRGAPLALLASARSAWLEEDDARRDALFERVELMPLEAQREQIVEGIVTSAAPTALMRLGHDHLRAVCGQRPIVALLIASDLEWRARTDQLGTSESTPVRGGELAAWLHRRLAADHLRPQVDPARPLRSPKPDDDLLAVAAIAAAAPQRRSALVSAAATAYAALDEPGGDPEGLVGLLERMGWLEPQGYYVATGHDVVTDEILQSVLLPGAGGRAYGRGFETLAKVAASEARAFGRVASALQRLRGSLGNEARTALDAGWANAHRSAVAEIAATLSLGEPDAASFALGAALSSSPTRIPVLEAWSEVVGRFLETRGTELEARHLYYVGLFRLDRDSPALATLVRHALAWLEVHGGRPEAGFVLGPLLARPDLSLASDGTDPDTAAVALVSRCLTWLARHARSRNASFLLERLLLRQDLPQAAAEAAGYHGLAWLEAHGLQTEARFVLSPLFSRSDLSKALTGRALKAGLDWLGRHGRSRDAVFVLDPLLGRSDVSESVRRASRSSALAWLETHHSWVGAGSIMARLVADHKLRGAVAARVIARSVVWLRTFIEELTAELVLSGLLKRPDLPSRARADVWRSLASMLEARDRATNTFLLRACLADRDIPEPFDPIVIRTAIAWLEDNPLDPEADYVFSRLLRRTTISAEDWRAVASLGFRWLSEYPEAPDRDHALNSLATRLDLVTARERIEIATRFDQWLAEQPESVRERPYVTRSLRRLLEREGLSPELVAKADPTRDLGDRLREIVARGESIEDDLLDKAVATLRVAAVDRPWGAAYLVAPLLALASRRPAEDLEPILEASLALADDPRMESRNLLGLAHSLHRLNKSNAFAPGTFQPILERLELANLVVVAESPSPRAAKDETQPESIRSWTQRLSGLVVAREEIDEADLTSAIGVLRAATSARPWSAGYLVPPLLALASRHSSEVLDATLEACEAVSRHPRMTSQNLLGLARALHRFREIEAFAPETFGLVFDRLGLGELAPTATVEGGVHRDDTLRLLVERLSEAIVRGESVDPSTLASSTEGLRAASASRPWAAGYLAPPLLALASHHPDETFESVLVASETLANDGRMLPQNRRGLANALSRLNSRGAFAPGTFEPVLERLGLAEIATKT